MVSELRKQLMAWMETDYSKHTNFRWEKKMVAGAFGCAKDYGCDSLTLIRFLYLMQIA